MGKLGVIITAIIILSVAFVGYLILLFKNKQQRSKGTDQETVNPYSADLDLIKKASQQNQSKASTELGSSVKHVEEFEQAFSRYNKKTSFFDTDEKVTPESEEQKSEEIQTKKIVNTTAVIKKEQKSEEIETFEQKVIRYQNEVMNTINFMKTNLEN